MPRKAAAKDVDDGAGLVVVEIEFDEEACRQRAYEISQSEDAGSPEENWIRAEAELRGDRRRRVATPTVWTRETPRL